MFRRLSCQFWPLLAALLFVPRTTSAATLGPAEPMRELNGGVFDHYCAAIDGRIYVIGQRGYVACSKIGEAGELAHWQYAQNLFPAGAGENYFCGAAWRNCVYVMGGFSLDKATGKSDPSAMVVMARAKADGGLEPWEKTTPLPEPRIAGAAVAVDGCLYFVGGGYQRRVFYARIRDDGGLGEWQETERLSANRSSMRLFAHGGYLYAVGGLVLHQRPADTAFRAKLKSDGSLEKWRRTEPLPEPRASYAGIVVGDDLFIWGGAAGPDAQQTASALTTKIGADGHFGDWAALAPLPMAASSLQAVFVGKWIYVIGGITMQEGGNKVWNTVWRYRVEDQ